MEKETIENNSEQSGTMPGWVKAIILAAVILLIVGATAFLILRGSDNGRQKDATHSGEGMYGTWASDYSKCIVTIEEDGTLTEVDGINKAVVTCSIEQADMGSYILTPLEGDFIFADYIYKEENGDSLLTSYIYLDTQQQVREEYISYYKSTK